MEIRAGLLNRLRELMEPRLDRLGAVVARRGLPPDFWTVLGASLSLLSGIAYSGLLFGDGFYGGLVLLLSGFADVLDGSVARATGAVSARGAFLDSTLDRLTEVAVFTGILLGGLADPPIVILALSFSMLVSYTRARAESLGVRVSGVGLGERAERLMILAVSSMLGYAYLGVVLVLLLTGVTFSQRLRYVVSALR